MHTLQSRRPSALTCREQLYVCQLSIAISKHQHHDRLSWRVTAGARESMPVFTSLCTCSILHMVRRRSQPSQDMIRSSLRHVRRPLPSTPTTLSLHEVVSLDEK